MRAVTISSPGRRLQQHCSSGHVHQLGRALNSDLGIGRGRSRGHLASGDDRDRRSGDDIQGQGHLVQGGERAEANRDRRVRRNGDEAITELVDRHKLFFRFIVLLCDVTLCCLFGWRWRCDLLLYFEFMNLSNEVVLGLQFFDLHAINR